MFVVSTDASQYAVGATISQDGHPIAYLSHHLEETEEHLATDDKEFLPLMIALPECSVYFMDAGFAWRETTSPSHIYKLKAA